MRIREEKHSQRSSSMFKTMSRDAVKFCALIVKMLFGVQFETVSNLKHPKTSIPPRSASISRKPQNLKDTKPSTWMRIRFCLFKFWGFLEVRA